MTLSEFWQEGMRRLSGLYPEGEASAMLRILCEDSFGIPYYKIVTEPGAPVPEGALDALERLSEGEPLQYVQGFTIFRSRRFKVGPGVLIPRPETEQLIDLALKHLPSSGRAIDLCTGSGCIAWSLALERDVKCVMGIDISPDALACASSQDFEAPVEFLRGDVLGELSGLGAFDVLTCNPPYVMDSQRAQMRSNVLDWEPSLALFVSDGDPLLFYRAVARLAPSLLCEGGYGVVEINDLLGPQTLELFAGASGLRDAALVQDIFGRDRFVEFFRA